MRVRSAVLLCLPAILFAALSRSTIAQTPPVSDVYAIVNARIEIGDGRVIEKGTVVIRDGLIAAVGADVTAPADAEVIKGDGLTVYPGFIDAYTSRGLTVPDGTAAADTPTDTSVTVSPSMREANRKGIRPEVHAADYLTLTDDLLKPQRSAGFTTQMVIPNGGTINGVGTIVNLNGLTRRDCVISPSVAMDFSFGTSGAGYPGSAMGIMAHTRQTLMDAAHYRELNLLYGRGGGVRPPDDPSLAALLPVITAAMPALYTANTEREIRRALGFAEEFHLNLWINGGVEAYKAAQLLSSKHVPVLLSLNFGPEPGVTAPAGGGPGGGGGGGTPRPGGGGGGGGRRNRPGGGAPGAPPAPGVPVGAPAPGVPGAPAGAQRPQPVPGGAAPPAAAPAPVTDDTTPKAVVAERHKKWEEKTANAAALAKAGVPFAFSTEGVRSQTEFMTNLRKAIAAGLPREAALKALTSDAARLLHIDRHFGTVEAGKSAAIIVMSGDFAVAGTTVNYLFIDREKFEPAKDIGPIIAQPQRRRGGEDDDAP